MKRTKQYAKQRFFVILLLLTVVLASCEQLGYLTCPIIPYTEQVIPLGPYDEEVGDCALAGKSVEIEAWLTELESIAESCRLHRETNWTNTLAERDNLDTRIDILVESEPLPTPTSVLDAVSGHPMEEVCNPYQGNATLPGNNYYYSLTHYYTYWLMRIEEDVGKYCSMIDELIKPLWEACDEINFYQDCQAPNADQYHTIVEMQMNVAQFNYDYTEIFYTDNLEVDGWDAFRTDFNASTLDFDCLREQQATFTFSMNAFCRFGSSSKYEKVATFLEGESVQIFGRNQNEPHWWLVGVSGLSEPCWVADSTGTAAGNLEDLEIIAAPPLVVSPENDNQEEGQAETISCSKDLGQSACLAAGGTWTQSLLGPFYCECK